MNPFYQAMNPQGNLMQQFQQFVAQMQGRNPNAMIQELVQSGRVTQDQLNQAQQKASQLMQFFR